MPKSPEEMAQAMVANMPEKTGRSIEEWTTLLAERKDEKHNDIIKHLKAEHGLTHGYANMIAHILRGGMDSFNRNDDSLVDQQFSGAKADLRPIYEKLRETAMGLGSDVMITPTKSYVAFRRNRQFITIRAAARTRVDVGINLKGDAGGGRLEKQTSANTMMSHLVRIHTLDEVDAELLGWIKQAYEVS
jgi:predicted transport protein